MLAPSPGPRTGDPAAIGLRAVGRGHAPESPPRDRTGAGTDPPTRNGGRAGPGLHPPDRPDMLDRDGPPTPVAPRPSRPVPPTDSCIGASEPVTDRPPHDPAVRRGPAPRPLGALFPSRARAALAAALLALAAVPAHAVPVPGFEREVRLMAREQPVTEFIADLFGELGLPVIVDDSVGGTVNGDFAKAASEVFDDLARSFQITLYYDGAVAYVYPSNAIRRTLRRLPPADVERLVRNAATLGLTDERNRLEPTDVGVVVTGTERFVEQVDELAEAVVVPPAPAPRAPPAAPEAAVADAYEVFPLRYAWADDVSLVIGGQELLVPGVASLLRELSATGTPFAPAGLRRRALPATVDGLRGEGLAARGAGDGAGRIDDPFGGGADASTGGAGDDVDLDGAIRTGGIVADSRNNAVLIRDRAERMPAWARLIASLDVEPAMLEIEATIIDLNVDQLRELGIDWRASGTDASAALATDPAGGAALVPGIDPLDALARTAGGVVSLVLGDEDRFLARIRALETQGAARVVSKPHVMTLANVEALLDTTSTFYVRVEGEEEVDLFDVSVGTTLRVTPHVFEAGGRERIKLLVAIEDGQTSERTVDAIPIVERSSINTQALIDGGQSLLVGGLVREFESNGVSKVPLFGDIPLVGRLFRSTSNGASRVERLFLITPRVVDGRVDPRRLSAPILFGDEADIVADAPRRLAGVRSGLYRRDATEPLAEPLPIGSRDVDLRTSREPPPVPEPPPRVPSVRERLLGIAPEEVRPTDPAGDGWQAVEGTWPASSGASAPAPADGAPLVAPTGSDRTTVSPDGTVPEDGGWEAVR